MVKLYADLNLTGTGNSQETDKVSMSFGWSPNAVVPEPSTYVAGALAVLPLLVGGVRKLRQHRANKA